MTLQWVLKTSLRLVAAAVLAIGMVIVDSPPAFAHAELVSATPAPGSGLPQAPGAVVIKFSEPLNRKLSTIAVLDGSGRDVATGVTLAVPGDRDAMERKLGLLPPGIYTVRWVTVSTVDGHTLRGSYAFGIGASPLGEETVASSPVASEGWGGLVGRWVALVGLALWIGSVALDALADEVGVGATRRAVMRRAGPALALVGTAATVLSSAWVASGSLRAVDGVLFQGGAGTYRLILLASTAAGLLVALLVGGSWWRPISLVVAGTAIVAEAASGHAAATSQPVLAIASLVVHLGAVGVWTYAIAASLLSGRRVIAALRRFSSWAVLAALAVGATGVLNATLELNSPGELTSTSYGKVVGVKALILVFMAVMGYEHFHERHHRQPLTHNLRDLLGGELVGAGIAIALTTVLVGFPNPPRQEAAAEQLTGPSVLRDIESGPALALAAASGDFVVGLTVLPPRPGAVRLEIQVIGVQAGDALRDAQVVATPEANAPVHVALTGCGLGCFRGHTQLIQEGTWRLDIRIRSNRGEITTTETVPLPAPDATGDLDRALGAMGGLQSARVHEELRSAVDAPPVITDYQFSAPDAFAFEIAGGAQHVTIGRREYARNGPSQPWTTAPERPAGDAFAWPGAFYGSFWAHPAAIRDLGTDNLDGTATHVIAFARPDVPAWFRLWIGIDDGLVHRMEMRAEGHLMDQQYDAFNAPLPITAPI